MLLDSVAEKIVAHFRLYLELDEIENAKMKLGFEVIVHDVCMIGLILTFAVYLHIFCESLAFFFIFGLFRVMAGGIHLKSSLGCILGTGCLIIGGVKISQGINLNAKEIVVIFVILIVLTYLLAPQGTENNPVKYDDYKKQKECSIIIICFYAIISIIFGEIRELVAIAACSEIFTLLLQYIKNRKIKKRD